MENFNPGFESDNFIDEKMMGGHQKLVNAESMKEYLLARKRKIPEYSTDINCAFLLSNEVLRQTGFKLMLEGADNFWQASFKSSVELSDLTFKAHHSTPAFAICKAALVLFNSLK